MDTPIFKWNAVMSSSHLSSEAHDVCYEYMITDQMLSLLFTWSVVTGRVELEGLCDVFRCSIDGVDDKRIISMQIDRRSHSLFVAFSSCVVKVPLSRCQRHGKCKKQVQTERFIQTYAVSPINPWHVSFSGPVSPPGTRTVVGCQTAPAEKSHLT